MPWSQSTMGTPGPVHWSSGPDSPAPPSSSPRYMGTWALESNGLGSNVAPTPYFATSGVTDPLSGVMQCLRSEWPRGPGGPSMAGAGPTPEGVGPCGSCWQCSHSPDACSAAIPPTPAGSPGSAPEQVAGPTEPLFPPPQNRANGRATLRVGGGRCPEIAQEHSSLREC